MTNEDVKFKRGLSTTLPETKVPGTVYITTDTGEMFVDDSDSSRIQIVPAAITNDEIDQICNQVIQLAEDVTL